MRDSVKGRLVVTPPVTVWDDAVLPPHLLCKVRIVDAGGTELAAGRDLATLRTQLGEAAQLSFADVGPALARRGLKSWDFGDLPKTLTTMRDGQRITGYPALIDDGDSVSVALLDTPQAAAASTRAGITALIRFALKDALSRLQSASASAGASGFTQSALQLKTVIPTARLLDDVLAAITDRAFIGDDPLPRSEAAFALQVKRARTRLPAVAEGAFRLLAEIAGEHHALTQRIAALPPALAKPGAEIRTRREALVYPGFFQATPWAQLVHLPRYLKALDRRLSKYSENPARDAKHAANVAGWWQRYRDRIERNRQASRVEPKLEAFRWLLEELQVSLFAQELKTPFPVSYKRLEKAWAELDR
jgi:ATP-dependent helicase HrpA